MRFKFIDPLLSFSLDQRKQTKSFLGTKETILIGNTCYVLVLMRRIESIIGKLFYKKLTVAFFTQVYLYIQDSHK